MNRLRDMREENDKNQEEIAELLNIKQPTYSQYELEQLDVSIENLKILSDFYNTSIDYLYFRTDERSAYSESKHPTNRLKELRNSINKSQRELAKELSIPKSTYIKYENNKLTLTVRIAIVFANYYKTSIDYIVNNTDDKVPYKKIELI